jgi:hypothetical protein
MKFYILLLLAFVVATLYSCSYYEYPTVRQNPEADRKVDTINRYLARYAPGCYTQFLRTPRGQLLGFCFYLNDSTYKHIQKLMGLPDWDRYDLQDRRKMLEVVTAAGNWLWNNVNRRHRMEGVRVVIGTGKADLYNTFEFGLAPVERDKDEIASMRFPSDDERVRYEYVLLRAYPHYGYELVSNCYYCF